MAIVKLDQVSSAPNEPYGIITADCSSPKEIDDGLFVEALDASRETYQVGVCVADTSKLYNDRGIWEQVIERTEAKYYQLPGGEQGYEPMIEPEIIRDLEFSAGSARSAMIIRFVVGIDTPPSDVEVVFGRVEVVDNQNYHDFWLNCQNNARFAKFERASKFIIDHLKYTSGRDADRDVPNLSAEAIDRQLIEQPGYKPWYYGSKINESFMVSSGHMVAKLMEQEGRPCIYRVHDPEDEKNLTILPPHLATYSWIPGPHNGLNLDRFSRVTSPLRRAEDFYLCGQLKKRHKGQPITIDDHRQGRRVVQALNQRIVADVMSGRPRTSDIDLFGVNSRAFARMVYEASREGSQVLPLHSVGSDEAIA